MFEHYRLLFARVRKRPRMFLPRSDYLTIVAFVEGCDQGNALSLLAGFREWLMTKVGCGDNLAWYALVGHLTEPIGEKSVHDMSPDEDAATVNMLFDLLDEFLAIRGEFDGLNRIFAAHSQWRAARKVSGCVASGAAMCPRVQAPARRSKP